MSKQEAGVIEQGRYTCAIGALETVAAIPHAMPILHSGPGCGEMQQGFFGNVGGYADVNTTPCTNFTEREVVFGGVDRLRENIANASKVLDSDLQVVLTGCTAGIVGDDVESVVEEFREQGQPIVSVETPGFKSSNFEAHSVVVNAIIDQYVDATANDATVRSERACVNLFASIPMQDPLWKGNLREYKRLLEGIGLKVHVLFGMESAGVAEWRQIPQANFNVLVSPWYGLPIVRHLEQLYGQPFVQFPHVPIGANEAEAFLRSVLDAAQDNDAGLDLDAAEHFITCERASYYEALDTLAVFLLEFRYGLPVFAHIIHDAGYVVGMSRFLLHETGIVPTEQFVVDGTPKRFQGAIRADLAATSDKRTIPLTFEPDAGHVQDLIRDITHEGRGLVIGSGWDRELAREKGYDFLSAAVPSPYRLNLTTNYVGFTGGLRLIEDVYNGVLATYR
ncbi:MAG: nitrogenase component 1 [Atopobiaceae bacterium]|nr:hypothetical protein [Atopobiaceae bacterium]MCH4180307.1 hypothetical protein [Atopobiaceae bacterium]MCH4214883.1 hypothetical protein [Atopobiaceae bacterium]MCH4229320.1 hypothetical protein [Atopobiaceae bacterium]MCH4276375.1 hypothetical protein [Atopobiaceae bacterium]